MPPATREMPERTAGAAHHLHLRQTVGGAWVGHGCVRYYSRLTSVILVDHCSSFRIFLNSPYIMKFNTIWQLWPSFRHHDFFYVSIYRSERFHPRVTIHTYTTCDLPYFQYVLALVLVQLTDNPHLEQICDKAFPPFCLFLSQSLNKQCFHFLRVPLKRYSF